MTARRTSSALLAVAALIALAACEDDAASTAGSAAVDSTTTTTVPAGGTGTTMAPVVSTAGTDGTDGADAPASTVANAPGAVDSATGLAVSRRGTVPAGTRTNQIIKGEAMISIDGPFPLALSGGLCSFVDTTLFIQAGDVSGQFITLSFVTVDTSLAAITDTSRISAEQLGWQTEDKSALSVPDELDIIFDEAGGISGSFAGAAVLAGPATPTDQIEFGGRFSCTPAPFAIRGAHGVHLTLARCDRDQGTVSAGGLSGDAALLAFDPASLASSAPMVSGALTFRVGTEEYNSEWMYAEIAPDGLGGTFVANMIGSDGVAFNVEGGFSCLGG